MQNSMALAPSLTRTTGGATNYFGRVVGQNTGTNPENNLKDNYAYIDMEFKTEDGGTFSPSWGLPNPSSSSTSLHGEGLSASDARTQGTWETAGFIFDGSPWIWNANGMPSLKVNGKDIGTVQPWPDHLQQ